MSYQNKSSLEVISDDCYTKLPFLKKIHWSHVAEAEPTHVYNHSNDDDSYFLRNIATDAVTEVIASAISSDSYSSGDFGSSSSTDTGFSGFGGGDFSGGGASGDF